MRYRSLIIVVEGPTEQEFIKGIFRRWLNNQNVSNVGTLLIRTSKTARGGNVNYAYFKNTVNDALKTKSDVLLTSLIDFFRLPNEFPGYIEAQKIPNAEKRIEFLEHALGKDIGSDRFIPYIQLHEFEALLFTDIGGFKGIPNFDERQLDRIGEIIKNYPNPELINDNPNTAPSKRLENIYAGYEKAKAKFGPLIAEENGISAILEKCPRFRQWAESLVERMESTPN